jgi:hypothetical protein
LAGGNGRDIVRGARVMRELGGGLGFAMADRKDKRSRKELTDRWKADQRAAARAKLPLPDDQMKAMFDMLDVEFPRQGCDHTLRITRAWLQSKGLPVEAVVAWLHDNGGGCDCEALANAEEAWLEANHDAR